MSEALTNHPEKHETAAKSAEQYQAPHTRVETSQHETAHERQKHLIEARQHIRHEEAKTNVNPLDKLKAAEADSVPATPQHINQELKQITLRRELQHIRRKLPAQERVLSRVIHQPAVRVVSDVVGKSVSRPSGLLGGGLLAFIGSTSYLYMAKHIGFSYNYGLFLVLFIGGFVLGVALEFLVYLLTSSRRRTDV